METRSDEQILALSRSQPSAFEELVRRYQRAFVRKATNILRDEEDAHDAVQEAFVRIYMAAGRFAKREGASFSSWAYTILVNQCYTAYRKKHRRELVSLEAVPELAEVIPDRAALEEIERFHARDQAMSLISRLPALLRRTALLHFIDGVPQKEMAAREGVSGSVIRTRLHRARKELTKLSHTYA